MTDEKGPPSPALSALVLISLCRHVLHMSPYDWAVPKVTLVVLFEKTRSAMYRCQNQHVHDFRSAAGLRQRGV